MTTTLAPSITCDREYIVQKVRRHGSASSSAVLDPNCLHFSTPQIDGLVGYRTDSSCAIVYGNPICKLEDREALVSAFDQFCQQQGLKVIYMGVDEEFARFALGRHCKILIEFGEELVIDPHDDPQKRQGVNASLVRRKVRHALKEEIKFFEYLSQDSILEGALEGVAKAWLGGREGLQVHISHVNLFADRLGKRWFYAKKQDKIVGVVMLNQIEAKQGWLLNHLMFTQEAPHGTPEFLLTSVLELLAKEGCHYVTFGNVPGKDLGEMEGINPAQKWLYKTLFKIVQKFLKLEGRKKFWEKFHPQVKRSYLLFSQPRIGIKELMAIKHATNVSLPRSK